MNIKYVTSFTDIHKTENDGFNWFEQIMTRLGWAFDINDMT